MIKKISLLACAAAALCVTLGAPGGPAAAAPQEYVEPVSLFRVRFGGGVYGGSVILTTDHTQVRALEKLERFESGVMGMVFARQMPNTRPLYRLAKQGTKPSPERYYTTDSAKVDDLVNNHGWASEGILCYVYSGMGGGTKPLYHLSKAGEHFYTTDSAERKRYKEVAGYKDEGVEAQILEHPFGWNADNWMFTDSAPGTGGPRPESYALVCRRGKGALFGKDGVSFKFTKGATKAGADLAEGECAWPDRKMGDGEPDVLLAPFTNDFGHTSAHRDEQYWTFKVYNDGRGRMVVTGAEPGRPPVQGGESIEVNRDVKGPEIKGPDVRKVRPVRPPKP
ncbi:MAG TPA: hypothetical protein VGB98_16480 [Pyrinomonadaceae bacterium]